MPIPNKRSVAITVSRDPGFTAPGNGNQAVQNIYIPNSDQYTEFAISIDLAGNAAVDSLNASISSRFVGGVAGGAANDSIGNLPAGYKAIRDLQNNQNLALVATHINFFRLHTPMRGGLVIRLTGINADNTKIYAQMTGSAYSVGAPRGA
jgi:hypothetical protein